MVVGCAEMVEMISLNRGSLRYRWGAAKDKAYDLKASTCILIIHAENGISCTSIPISALCCFSLQCVCVSYGIGIVDHRRHNSHVY